MLAAPVPWWRQRLEVDSTCMCVRLTHGRPFHKSCLRVLPDGPADLWPSYSNTSNSEDVVSLVFAGPVDYSKQATVTIRMYQFRQFQEMVRK